MHKPTIMLAAAALLCACAAQPVVERTAPPTARSVPPSPIHADHSDRVRIRAEREKALRNTPSGRAQECREAFKSTYSRGIVDALAIEVANVYLEISR
jgi:hypothetical protein